MKRLRSIALFTVIAVSALLFCFISSATGDTPVLYRNDTKYTIAEYPAKSINGKVYVPLSFFIGLNNIQYEYNSDPAGFYLMNKSTGRYFSFSSNAKSIVVDSTLVNIEFPIENSTIYMPLEYCAEILSLTVEKKSEGSTQRIRLSDGTQKLTFDELIELYDPTEIPDIPPVIEPEKPVDPIVTPVPSDRYIYITVDALKGADISGILDVLEENKTKITFFFDADTVYSNPEAVIRTFVEGHGIGICGASQEEVKEANNALYSVLHLKSLLCRSEEKELSHKGYILWGWDINADTESPSPRNTARDIYNKTFSKKDTVVRFEATENSSAVIDGLLYYISGDEYIISRVIDPTVATDREVQNG